MQNEKNTRDGEFLVKCLACLARKSSEDLCARQARLLANRYGPLTFQRVRERVHDALTSIARRLTWSLPIARNLIRSRA